MGDTEAGGGSKGSGPAATRVGKEFAKKYYDLLATNPAVLYRFYKQQSVFSFTSWCGNDGGGGGSTVCAVGQQQIHREILAALTPFKPEVNGGHEVRPEVICIDSQGSRRGAVIVLVTGYLMVVGTSIVQHFTQSFFLDRQSLPYEGYFVLNDILRFLPPGALPVRPSPASPSAGPRPEAFYKSAPTSPAPALPASPAAERAGPDAQAAELAEDAPSERGEAGGEVEIELDIEGAEDDDLEEAHVEGLEAWEPGVQAAQATQAADDEDDDDAQANSGPGNPSPSDEDLAAIAAAEEEAASSWPQPKSWSSMASKLKQGPGQLAASKAQGYAAPGGSAVPAASEVRNPRAEALRSALGSTGSAAGGNVWLWVSRLPSEPAVESQEMLDCINGYLSDSPSGGRAVEVDRKDAASQDRASVAVTTQEAADAVVQLSKEWRLLLRGKSLKADLHKHLNFSGGWGSGSSSRRGRGGGGRGGGVSGRGRGGGGSRGGASS